MCVLEVFSKCEFIVLFVPRFNAAVVRVVTINHRGFGPDLCLAVTGQFCALFFPVVYPPPSSRVELTGQDGGLCYKA